MGPDPISPQQRAPECPGRAPTRRRPGPVRGHRPRLRQRQRVHQPRRDRLGREPEDLLHPLSPLSQERPDRHRVKEQPPRPPPRVLLALRHPRDADPAQPALAAGERPAELLHPDEEARRLVDGHRRAPQTHLRHPANPARPAPGRRGPLPGPGSRTARSTGPDQPRRPPPRHPIDPGPAHRPRPRSHPRTPRTNGQAPARHHPRRQATPREPNPGFTGILT